jgi:hypothetical protein
MWAMLAKTDQFDQIRLKRQSEMICNSGILNKLARLIDFLETTLIYFLIQFTIFIYTLQYLKTVIFNIRKKIWTSRVKNI